MFKYAIKYASLHWYYIFQFRMISQQRNAIEWMLPKALILKIHPSSLNLVPSISCSQSSANIPKAAWAPPKLLGADVSLLPSTRVGHMLKAWNIVTKRGQTRKAAGGIINTNTGAPFWFFTSAPFHMSICARPLSSILSAEARGAPEPRRDPPEGP